MPYSKKAERTFEAVSHGWTPKKKALRKLTKATAKKLLAHK